jgi:hypothetical protein
VFLERRALARNLPRVRDPELLDRVYDRLVVALTGEPGRTLVLQTDINPINRLLVFAARAAGLRSVCIQHGIRLASSAAYFGDGYYADFTMVYDSHQRAAFAARGLDPARLPILGFYESPVDSLLPPLRAGRERRICLLGQSYTRSGRELGRRYVELLRRVHGELRAAGLAPVFKPHPRELRESYMAELEPHFDGSMQEALARFDVFLSFGSTALLEGTLAGRVAIQLYDARLGGERLDEAPYAHTLPVEHLGELPRMCLETMPVGNPELTVLEPGQLADRFVEQVERLDPSPLPYPDPPS